MSVLLNSSFKCTSLKMISCRPFPHLLQGMLRKAPSSLTLTPCYSHEEAFSKRSLHTERCSSIVISSSRSRSVLIKRSLTAPQFSRLFSEQRLNSSTETKQTPLSTVKSKTAVKKQTVSISPSSPGDPLAGKGKTESIVSSYLNDPSIIGAVTIYNPEEWTTVYRFHYVKLARAVQKLKIFQTAFTTLIALPGTLGFYLYGAIQMEHVAFMMSMSMLACTMLYVMGNFCSRLIGFIYVSKSDPSIVRVAHLNFWGKRIDEVYKKTDFVPFSELPDNVRDIYVNVKFYFDEDVFMNICVRYGEVLDKMEFIEIFGTHCGIQVTEADVKQKSQKSKEIMS